MCQNDIRFFLHLRFFILIFIVRLLSLPQLLGMCLKATISTQVGQEPLIHILTRPVLSVPVEIIKGVLVSELRTHGVGGRSDLSVCELFDVVSFLWLVHVSERAATLGEIGV